MMCYNNNAYCLGIVAEFLMMVACLAPVYAKPFVVDSLDVYEFVSLITSSLLFFLSQVLHTCCTSHRV